MKSLTNDILEQIKICQKNRLDIAHLIRDVDIRRADLSNTIITELDVHDQDIRETNFANCVIGLKDNIVNFNRAIIDGCCFIGTTFPGTVWARRVRARNCNFKRAFIPYCDYRYADFAESTFCDTIFCIGTEQGYGAFFDESLFKELAKNWKIKVIEEDEYTNLLAIKQKYEALHGL